METLKNLTIEELEGVKKFINDIQTEKRKEFILVEKNLHKFDELGVKVNYIPENDYYMKSNRTLNYHKNYRIRKTI